MTHIKDAVARKGNHMMNTGKLTLATIVFASITLMITACSEFPDQFSENTHFTYYPNVLADQLALQPELASANVLEFFTYGCQHCQAFAPKLSQWHEKHQNQRVVYVPVIWDELTEMHARLFYLIQSEENFKGIHHELFAIVGGFSRTDSIEDQKVQLVVFLQQKGIQPKDVVEALNTSKFDPKTASSLMLAKRFEISGTPTVVVDKQYKILNNALKDHDSLFSVMDELLAKKY